MSKFKDLASNSFFKRDYKRAMLNYSLALKESPNDEEARIGVLLSDMATEKEDKAVALFEYYEVSKLMDAQNAHEIMENIINSVEENDDVFENMIHTIQEHIITIEDGIIYDDFIAHVQSRENVKRAIEDLMFSTKIIIYKKEDFIELIEMLMHNSFIDLAYQYIESAMLIYPNDPKFYKLLQELELI